jgi:acyl-CoA reductase-like NAD-dependent aldehyde dehydrogenase
VDFAVEKARDAFEDGRWSRLHPSERKEVLIRLAKLMKRNARELAVMESLDSGKTIYDCETVDVPETIHCLTWHAELIDKIYDQVSPASDDHIAMILREPVGVVGLVLPWNFPLLMLAWKIGPALAAGCSVIVKPAEETSLTALRVAELAMEAGVPPGRLQRRAGIGAGGRRAAGRHMDVDMVSFTGSTETGRRFLSYAAESNLKEVTLEMGGKNPAIVLDDAENLDRVAAHVVNGAFWNMGENCSASSRLIVQKGVKDALLERIAAHVREWPMGDPLDPENRVGALVSRRISTRLSYLGKDVKGRDRRQGAGGLRRTHGDRGEQRRQAGAGGDLRPRPVRADRRQRRGGHRAGQRHPLRARRLDLHRQHQARASWRPGDPRGDRDREQFWRGRHHDPLRRVQAIGLRRARQRHPRPRPVYPGEDHLGRPADDADEAVN